jgi:hypothetical protein
MMPATTVATHGLKLLQLVRGENRSELTLRVLPNSLELLTPLITGEAGVGAQSCHLLLLSSKDGFQLRGLVVRQVEAFAEPLRSLMRIEVMMPVLLRRLLLGGSSIVCRLLSGLLTESRRGGKSECQS